MSEIKDFKALGLPEELLAALAQRNFPKPTAIQAEAIPRILAGGSMIGRAPTGTGKTLAYLLPLLARLDGKSRSVQAAVLAPTYELAMQITNEARELINAGKLPVKVLGLIGGANITRQIEKLKEKPQLIVGSAGRLLELARRNKLRLNETGILVLDEFDRLLDDQNLQNTADLVRLLLPREQLQVLLFSATASHKALERASFLGKPEMVEVAEEPGLAGNRRNLCRITPFREKAEMVRRLTRRLGIERGLVFIGKRYDVEKTLAQLRYEGLQVESLIGAGGKQERAHAVDAFRKGRARLLLATDVAARGLDIPGIDYVINLDVPESAEAYLHRAGRTARAGATGTVLTLADAKEAHKLEKLEKQLHIRLLPLEQELRAQEQKKAAGRQVDRKKRYPQQG